MERRINEEKYCVFCEATETLKEFKANYVCEECIESAKSFEAPCKLDEID
ncbi:MAG: hypothetical protein JEZ08_14725 [Clostridiales bacterium]|nr:hypothetical protein [Clostridiales bacterium]